MKLLPHLLLLSVCVLLMMPTTTEAGWVRGAWRQIIRNPKCTIGWKVVCPAAVDYATSGAGTVIGKAACKAKANSCRRRTLDEEEDLRALGLVSVAFDPDFEEYDRNEPYGFIDFQEFVETIARVLPISEEELAGPFNDADVDDDGLLSKEEFEAAPFDFEKNIGDDDQTTP